MTDDATDPGAPDEQRTLLICHHDPAQRAVAAAAGTARSLRDVGEVSMFTEALAMVSLVDPDIVVIDRRAAGLDGLDALRELVAASPTAGVVVVTDEPATAPALMAAGAVAVAVDGDRAELEAALDRAVAALGAERGVGAGRRSGQDRRIAQDWSKVTSERRSAQRRSGGDRRDDERTDGDQR